MFIKNIKRYTASLLLTSAMILTCGCQSTEDIPRISDSGSSAPPQNVTNKDDVITTAPESSEIAATVTESEPVTASAETTEKVLEPIPKEWIPIEDYHYVFDHFDEIMNTDNSSGDIGNIISLLVYKSTMLHYTQLGRTYELDHDNPITYGEEKITLYPASSAFFPDVKSFYELVSDIYENAEKHYIYDPSANSIYVNNSDADDSDTLFFTEIDGKMYVNVRWMINRGGPEPFTRTSYIEITEETEDMYKFTWHYPDVERLNEPDKYIDYYYYEKYYKIVYSGGEWHLDRKVGY